MAYGKNHGAAWSAMERKFSMTRDARLSALHRGGFGLRGRASRTGICAGSVTASSSHPGRNAWRAGSRAPAIHPLREKFLRRSMDPRVKPAGDGERLRPIRVKPGGDAYS